MKTPNHGRLLINEDNSTAVGEQFRFLRTRIELAGPGTFMITSALDQEGKTLCAVNLAVVLSRPAGPGVLLVDADVRHPSLGSHFSLTSRPGLVDCLLGQASWHDCVYESGHERLKVLPAGRPSRLAPELIDSDRMAALTADLRAGFPEHYLLFDTPPVLLTADPLVIARHMDHILLVIRADVTPRAAVTRAVETLGTERILGAVFNGATRKVSQYYYYGYAYGRYPYRETTEPAP
jgi:protein-tyrosine kinase